MYVFGPYLLNYPANLHMMGSMYLPDYLSYPREVGRGRETEPERAG
jgi:hypothetical protein